MKPNLRCTICGLVRSGAAVPDRCPECGARGLLFEPTDEPPHGIPHNPFQPRDPRAAAVGPGDSGCLYPD